MIINRTEKWGKKIQTAGYNGARTVYTLLIIMTTLLTHTFAHSTKPSFMPQNNNQLPKKFLRSVEPKLSKWQNSDFQSQFSMSENIQIFLKIIFIEEYDSRGTVFVIDIF